MWRGRCRGLVAVVVCAALTAAAAIAAAPGGHPGPAVSPSPLEIESWAPGVFEGAACPSLKTVTWRVDATVYLPLLLTSVPIASRENVGAAAFNAYDCAEADSARLRAFEFFAGSYPERARGLNRLGFLREAIRLRRSGPEETAQFGVMTVNDEDSVEEAERALESSNEGQKYSFISGVVGPREASNTVVKTTMNGRWANARDLYREVRPRWDVEPPSYVRRITNEKGDRYDAPVGFLGSLAISLRLFASAVDEGGKVDRSPVGYVHNGQVYRLHVVSGRVDNKQGKAYAATGLVAPGAAVWHVQYRILSEKRKEVSAFSVWTELPHGRVNDAFAPPIVPLSFEYKPRSFLQLRAVRVGAAG